MAETVVPCLLHEDSVKESEVRQFTLTSWAKFKVCANQWIKLDGNGRLLAERNADLLEKELQECTDRTLGYHLPCYQRFTNKVRIKGAEKRCMKHAADSKIVEGSPGMKQAATISPAKKRKFHPHNGTLTTSTASEGKSILPQVCIICKKVTSFVYGFGRKRVRDKLVQAQTTTAGNLLEAAIQKADQDILLLIHGKDCVDIEVKYHAQCFKKYTKSVVEKRRTEIDGSEKAAMVLDPAHKEVYGSFSKEIITERLINNKEILCMTRLTIILNDMLEKKGVHFTYRNDQLKHLLKKDFPQLNFHAPNQMNMSKIVYVEMLTAGDFRQNYSSSSVTEDGSSTGSESATFLAFGENPVKTLYNAGLQVKCTLNDSAGLTCPWLPTSVDLTTDAVRSVVPEVLFNFLAWSVGASEDPVLDKFVAVSDDVLPRLLSICQDLVSLASNGQKLTLKS
ncbi:uncharacterized protein LOC126830032 [Patella vulgata]|uniref:uncharacterized protein LOC126830032 n=1 Tax=Patella vulgata TaxID=6465 RepID=UPI00218069F1|nr:uncharacterized protein LOC126830032 [Patella vulgata]